MRSIRVILGIVAWLIIFAITQILGALVIATAGALILGALNINVSQNAEAIANLKAAANILSFVLGVMLGLQAYRWITRGPEQRSATTTE